MCIRNEISFFNKLNLNLYILKIIYCFVIDLID